MLVIGKPAEFSPDNIPVRGQCQPHTKGWRLRLVHRGQEEILHEDSYYACRQVQLACQGLPEDEIRQKAREIAAQITDDLQETQRINTGEAKDEEGLSPPPDAPVAGSGRTPDTRATEVIPKNSMEKMPKRRKKNFEE